MQSFVIVVAALAVAPLIVAPFKKEDVTEEKNKQDGTADKESVVDAPLEKEGITVETSEQDEIIDKEPLIDGLLEKEGITVETSDQAGVTDKKPIEDAPLENKDIREISEQDGVEDKESLENKDIIPKTTNQNGTADNKSRVKTPDYEVKCPKRCAIPVPHYVEVGCEPVYSQPGDCCPTHYICAEFESRPRDKCYFQGITYNKDDIIESHITKKYARFNCRCTINEFPKFVCDRLYCSELMNHKQSISCLPSGCYKTYDFDHYCPKTIRCPPFDNLAHCKVGKRVYREEERWFPKKGRKKCICQLNFKGILEQPFCRNIYCRVDLLQTEEMLKKCAPIFPKSYSCPIGWKCPDGEEEIIRNRDGSTSKQQCSYGDKKLNIGEKIAHRIFNNTSIKCACKIPPLLTCVSRPSPESFEKHPMAR